MGLNLFKYWWSLTHSLPRHGRFWYLKEILIKSQYSAQQSHPKSDVKIKNISNSMISPGNKWQKSDSLSSRHDKNHIKDSFEYLRTWGIHKPQYFILKIKDLTNMLWYCKFFPSILSQVLQISSFLTSDLGWLCWALYLLLIKVSVRYKNRPCLGREWVIDHQYLRRLRSNNRVLQIIAF